jgi:3-oxoacyl-[acyl-carrier protein] reductase
METLTNDTTLDKKIMVITGTSKGIGLGLAQYFVNKNYIVVGASRSIPSWEHPEYFHFKVDVTDEKMVQSWARDVKRRFKKTDILINNVGLVKSSLQVTLTPLAIFEEFIKINLSSSFLVSREFSKAMIMQRHGRIINISSIMTQLFENGTGAYTATKSAIESLSKVMAKELISHNITVNNIAPSMVITDSNRQLGEEWEKWMLDKQVLKRAVTIEEIANIIEFFSSPLASVITGQTIQTCYLS